MPKPKDLAGMRFGRLTAVAITPERYYGYAIWECRCDCGATFKCPSRSLISGNTTSCGCLRKDNQANRTGSDEYQIWADMKGRCLNKANEWYSSYGGRGIKVHEPWIASFDAFIADVGRRPSAKHSLDRVDNDGNYEPGNVRWATGSQQQRNRRDSLVIEFNGKRQHLMDWSKEIGIDYATLRYRLNVFHWSVERTLTTPVTHKGRRA